MKNIFAFIFVVRFLYNNEIRSKEFNVFADAAAAYKMLQEKHPNFPRQIESVCNGYSVILGNHNWGKKTAKLLQRQQWKEEAERLLIAAKIKKPQREALLSLKAEDLRAAVVGRNVDRLIELDGIGEKTAKKAIFALRPICKAASVKYTTSREFTRVVLDNSNYNNMVLVDKICKGVSPVEAKAIELGGDDAIIHCVSYIEPAKEGDLDGINHAEDLAEYWASLVHNGLVLNGVKYVPFGHGTNAAKECKTIWVKETIYTQMRRIFFNDHSNPRRDVWETTPAKKLAYEVGLQAVTRKSVGVVFHPEDFCILPDVISNVHGDHIKEFLDGHEELLENHDEPVNRSDGYMMIHIPENMYPEMINRMVVERGMSPEEAEDTLKSFVLDFSVNSYRCNGAAIKGCGDKRVDFHAYLADKGITKTPDGRSLNTVAILCGESVLKTSIGPKGKYATFQDWCDAVGGKIDLGICVKAHPLNKKDVSYQVIQVLCEATKDQIINMVTPTINRVNNAHTVEGASHLLNREQGHILRILPALANERSIKENLQHKLKDMIDEAFSGKLLKESYYAFITPDPIYTLQGWFGLPLTGCLNEGEFAVPGVKLGKLAAWRSPVMHPNSVRVVNNVEIPAEFRKYIRGTQPCITMNSKDDISLAMAADWDGDHCSVSPSVALVDAVEETLKIWNKLVIWETPKTQKKVVTREDELEYFANLTKKNELGLTVFGLNALLNRILKYKDEQGETHTKVIPVSHRGVNFKVFAGNVLVDAGKHGGAEIDEPIESSMSGNMLQPWAKQYRDLVENKADQKYLDELARLDNKMARHMAGTLNKLFALYAKYINRSTKIVDLPEGKFNWHKLMFNPEETKRTIRGLFRRGNGTLVNLDGTKIRPDQGLFDSIAASFDIDRAAWYADTSRKDEEDTSFEEAWRVNALAEIEAYVNAMGYNIEDAYDYVTMVMFRDVDNQYATMDGKFDFIRDRLWRTYWLVFGGMAEEAAERWEKEEDAD